MTHQGYPPEDSGHGRLPSTPEIATQAVAEPDIEEVVDAKDGAPVAIMATGRGLWRRLATVVAGCATGNSAAAELRCMRCGRAGRLLRADEPDEGDGKAGLDSS